MVVIISKNLLTRVCHHYLDIVGESSMKVLDFLKVSIAIYKLSILPKKKRRSSSQLQRKLRNYQRGETSIGELTTPL